MQQLTQDCPLASQASSAAINDYGQEMALRLIDVASTPGENCSFFFKVQNNLQHWLTMFFVSFSHSCFAICAHSSHRSFLLRLYCIPFPFCFPESLFDISVLLQRGEIHAVSTFQRDEVTSTFQRDEVTRTTSCPANRIICFISSIAKCFQNVCIWHLLPCIQLHCSVE